MISTLLIKYKWIIAFITSLIILKIISWVRNKINSDIEKRFSSPEEKAKVSVDLFGRFVQVRPAQFVFDSPERFYPYLFNKFNRYVIAHQFKKSNREIRFVFEAFPNLIHLKEKDIEPMKIKFGVSGGRKIVEMDLNDNFSNLRLIDNVRKRASPKRLPTGHLIVSCVSAVGSRI